MSDTATQFDSNTMDDQTYQNIIAFLKESNVNYLSLLGGEPTLHPKFQNFLDLAYENNIKVSVKTNALFIKSAKELFGKTKGKKLHFLINLNHPNSMGENKWKKTCENLKELSKLDHHVDFQINIDKRDFDYSYLWDVMKDFKNSILYWTFTVPIHNPKSRNTFVDPFKSKKEMMPKVLKMLADATDAGHRTFGTHGITPCLFPKGFLKSNKEQHQIGSNCVPVFDFYPDHSVHYCFPLEGHNSVSDFRKFDNLQQIQSEFLWKASNARPLLFPWKECIGCDFAASGECHGGCMSNKPWLKETYNKLNDEINPYEFTPSLTKEFEEIVNKFPNLGWSKKLKKEFFQIHPRLWKEYLKSIDGKKTLNEIKEELDQKFNKNTSEWINIINYNLLGRLDLVFLPIEHDKMVHHES